MKALFKDVIKFIVLYIAQVGALWGLLEGYSYFRGDALKNSLGGFWILIYIIPFFTAIFVITLGSNDEEKKVEKEIKTAGDFSPGQVDGNYSIRKPLKSRKSSKTTSLETKDDVVQTEITTIKANIETKGDYSPGEVKGDYTIEG